MKIKKIRIENFRGIEHFECEFGENITTIAGDNGTGKTTVADAISWILFDRNTTDEKNWLPKTITDGEAPTAIVEAVIENDGVQATLRKEFKEVWKNKRNSVDKTFTGHTTEYYINDVPVMKDAYDDYMKAITKDIDGRLVSMVGYFADMKTADRRSVIISLIDDVDDCEILRRIENGDVLSELMNRYSIDEIMKMAKTELKDINAEIKANQIIYDRERQQGMMYDSEKVRKLEDEKKSYGDMLQEYAKHAETIRNKQNELNNLNFDIYTIERVINDKKAEIEAIKHELDKPFIVADKCEVCGAKLSNDVIEKQVIKHDDEIRNKKDMINRLNEVINGKTKAVDELTKRVDEIEREISILQESQLTMLNVGNKIDEINRQLTEYAVIDSHNKNAEKARSEVERLSVEAEKWERIQYHAKEFIKTKAEMVTDKVNAMFDGSIRFKMFDTNINGTLKEECEPMIDCDGTWIPYKSANTGTKVNAGIKIIDVISRKTGVYVPVLVDNAESVTKLITPKDLQLIRFAVDKLNELKIY